MRGKTRWTAGASLIALTSLLAILAVASAGAASQCAGQETSADGTIVYGDACSETIVATSPEIEKIYAGGGNDVIFANPDVEEVVGGEGDDVIYGELPNPEPEATVPYEPGGGEATARRFSRAFRTTNGFSLTATISTEEVECAPRTQDGKPCYGGAGNQVMKGGAGNDLIFGQRGNDELLGEGGNDTLYAGIGDDTVKGGNGADLVSGGYGKDFVDGQENGDLVRGDGTTDLIKDSGSSGLDTLSYATGTTPGFHGEPGITNFPADADGEERGVEVHLDGSTACVGIGSAEGIAYQGCDNASRYGGGSDEVQGNVFENLIGSPFSDVLIGSSSANQIFGGGGADVIKGGEGNDTLYGGAEGDYIDGGAGTNTVDGQFGNNNCFNNGGGGTINNCVPSPTTSVEPRNRKLISVGFMSVNFPSPLSWSELYLLGSEGEDVVTARYEAEGAGRVKFTATAGTFSTESSATTPNCTYAATTVTCNLPKPLDTIVLAGLKGNDTLSMEAFPETTTPILLGGEGGDILKGGATEDLLVDGNTPANDHLEGLGFDDALVNNEGTDRLEGGQGNDLLVSLGTCEGDVLQGATSKTSDEEDVNNASWAPAPAGAGVGGVTADMAKEREVAGNTYGSSPGCELAGTELDQLGQIDALEGSAFRDLLYGDENKNSLFGRNGEDRLFSRGGEDVIESRDGAKDEVNAGGSEPDWCRVDGLDETTSCDHFMP